MTTHPLILIGTALVNNIVMLKTFGLRLFMKVSKKLESAASKGIPIYDEFLEARECLCVS